MGGLEVIDPRYGARLEQFVAGLDGDERVLAVALSGSVAAGTADEWSDLDIQIVAAAEHYDGFLGDWPTWLAEIVPTVFARTPIAPFIINVVTADGLTLDILVGKGQAFEFPQSSEYVVGMLSGVGSPTSHSHSSTRSRNSCAGSRVHSSVSCNGASTCGTWRVCRTCWGC